MPNDSDFYNGYETPESLYRLKAVDVAAVLQEPQPGDRVTVSRTGTYGNNGNGGYVSTQAQSGGTYRIYINPLTDTVEVIERPKKVLKKGDTFTSATIGEYEEPGIGTLLVGRYPNSADARILSKIGVNEGKYAWYSLGATSIKMGAELAQVVDIYFAASVVWEVVHI